MIVDNSNHNTTTAYLHNYYLFSVLFSIVHATVDGVLAFSAAELGAIVGSYAGFALYCVYTLTSLLFARPVLLKLSSKWTVFLGLCGMLIYVGSFLLALLWMQYAFVIFVMGAILGGFGAGLLWPGQGIYFSNVARQVTIASSLSSLSSSSSVVSSLKQKDDNDDSNNTPESTTSNLANINTSDTQLTGKLSGIFAFFYLSLESLFKVMATVVFVNYAKGSTGWRPIVFGVYTTAAVIAAILFGLRVKDVDDFRSNDALCASILPESNERGESSNPLHSTQYRNLPETDQVIQSHIDLALDKHDISVNVSLESAPVGVLDAAALFSVARAIRSSRLLQLLLPFQICFGMSTGLIDFYINKDVVAVYIGDGYIGLLSAITTITAAILSLVLAMAANSTSNGKAKVMYFGGFCFLAGPLLILLLPIRATANWPFLVMFFVLHGAARGVWEGINKSVVADYFPAVDERGAAFAAIYFTSGLAGAVGFIVYQFMSPTTIAALNVVACGFALMGYARSDVLYRSEVQRGSWRTINIAAQT